MSNNLSILPFTTIYLNDVVLIITVKLINNVYNLEIISENGINLIPFNDKIDCINEFNSYKNNFTKNNKIEIKQEIKPIKYEIKPINNIEITRLINLLAKAEKNTKDYETIYNELNTEFTVLNKTDYYHMRLIEYIKDSRSIDKQLYGHEFVVKNIYKLNRKNEFNNYDNFCKNINNKTLLFHGSTSANILNILRKGLLINPKNNGINVAIHGKAYGNGLYFSNSCTKCINYTHITSNNRDVFLLICEVALGNICKGKIRINDYNNCVANNYNSYNAVSTCTFDGFEQVEYNSDILMPKGQLTQTANNVTYSLFDEFIVYHEHQVKITYIAHLVFDFIYDHPFNI